MEKYQINKSDKIFARLSMGGRTLVEFMMNGVGSVGEVIAELRRMCGEVRGLAKLYIRNHSQGWSIDRGLMVYSHEGSLRQSAVRYGELPLDFDDYAPRTERRMLAPWETH